MRMLLLSNSTNHGETFLAHARERIAEFARGEPVSFVPFALADRDGYTERVRNALGLEVVGVHRDGQPARAIAEARCLFVGGGNTLLLLDALYRLGVLEVLRRRVRSGELAYAGASAGTNVAAPTIRTTNDMPIVDPPGLAALGLVPFQINPPLRRRRPGLDADGGDPGGAPGAVPRGLRRRGGGALRGGVDRDRRRRPPDRREERGVGVPPHV